LTEASDVVLTAVKKEEAEVKKTLVEQPFDCDAWDPVTSFKDDSKSLAPRSEPH